MALKRLIIEGVAGTGKSSVIAQLTQVPAFRDALIINEDLTLGELFSEMQDKSIPYLQHIRRLETVLSELETKSISTPVILERFHHSYFALGIPWDLLQGIDSRLARLGFKTALLDFPDTEFADRTLRRRERDEEGWEAGFLQLYGSVEKAVSAFQESQERRKEALKKSQLSSQIFDTSFSDWAGISNRIADFA